MKYTFDGTELGIVPNATEICTSVPCGTYTFTYSKFTGLHVVKTADIKPVDFKLYGKLAARVNKSFNAYERRAPKNTGVLLSGEPGMGKSLFIRLIANKAIEHGIPVFLVNDNLPGIVDFLSELNCPAMIILDEFEKVYRPTEQDQNSSDDGENSSQEKFLSLMDGVAGDSVKMFVAAVNDVNRVSRFMINRPGRFLYHFEFGGLGRDEITEVCDSCLNDPTIGQELVIRLTGHLVNYDALFAIVDELNAGESIDDTFADLNLLRTGNDVFMKCTLHTTRGDFYESTMMYGLGRRGREHELTFNAGGVIAGNNIRAIRVRFDDADIGMLPDGRMCVKSDKLSLATGTWSSLKKVRLETW